MGFFVQRMTEINNAEINRNYHLMFRLLIMTSDCFHKVDRAKIEEERNLMSKYVREIESTDGRHYNHTLQLRASKASHFYVNGGKEVKLTVIDMLWEGGYINKTMFGFHDPSGGRKSGKG